MPVDNPPLAARVEAVEAILSELRNDFNSGILTAEFYYRRLEALIARQQMLKAELDKFLRAQNAEAVADTLAALTSDASDEEVTAAISATTLKAKNEPGAIWAQAWLETVGDTVHAHRGKLVDLALTGVIAVAKGLF